MVGELRYGLGLRNTHVDIADGNDTPIVRFTGSPVSGTILGNAGNFPIHRDQTDHQFVYNLSWFLARDHSFKAGTDIRRQQLDDFADNFSRGFWTFNATLRRRRPTRRRMPRCSTAASRRTSRPRGRSSSRTGSASPTSTSRTTGACGTALTVNLGLRYEYVSAPKRSGGSHRLRLPRRHGQLRAATGRGLGPAGDVGLAEVGSPAANAATRRSAAATACTTAACSSRSSRRAARASGPTRPTRSCGRSRRCPASSTSRIRRSGFVFVPGPQTARVSHHDCPTRTSRCRSRTSGI